MTPGIYDGHAFEDAIEAHLLERGGYEGIPSEEFDRDRAPFPNVVVSFVKETQPEKWEQLETAYKGNAREAFYAISPARSKTGGRSNSSATDFGRRGRPSTSPRSSRIRASIPR